MFESDPVFTVSQAEKDFYSVAATVDKQGEAVVLQDDRPKYLIVALDATDRLLDLTEDEKIDIVAKRVLERYLPAFKELAK